MPARVNTERRKTPVKTVCRSMSDDLWGDGYHASPRLSVSRGTRAYRAAQSRTHVLSIVSRPGCRQIVGDARGAAAQHLRG